MTETTKYDSGKPRYELIPPTAMEELARVYTMGANRYGDHNWRIGTRWTRLLGALLRHTFAWARGESFDPDSGYHHMAHAAFNALALIEYEALGLGDDDRVDTDERCDSGVDVNDNCVRAKGEGLQND